MRERRGRGRGGVTAGLVALLLVTGCGGDGEDAGDTGAGPTSKGPAAPSADTVPQAEVSLDDLDEPGDPEIAELLGFYEGGDNACGSVEEGRIREEPLIVDTAFRDSPDIQIGWDYSLCWTTDGVDSLELIAPDGEVVVAGPSGSPLPLLPGSPLGTYTAVGTIEGRRLEAEVEVVPAREPRLFLDPVTAEVGPGECPDELRAHLVGFTEAEDVELAVYDWSAPQAISQTEGRSDLMAAELLGTISVPVDDAGSASAVLDAGSNPVDGSLTIVADPVVAAGRWSTDEPPPREDLMVLDFDQQLAVDGCLGAG